MTALSSDGKPLVSNAEQDHETMDRAIARLNEQKQVWAHLPVRKKIAYLEQMRPRVEKVADRWVAAATQAKGIPAGSPLAGEEWLSGPYALLSALNSYLKTLRAIDKTGYPDLKPSQVRTRPDGQVIVDVFPQTIYDRLLLSGVSAEVWMQPGVTKENLRETMAVWYRNPDPQGKVTLVLGAGNIASIPPLDVLYKLLAEGQVCLLKMNPVNDYLGPFLEESFGSLVTDGFVQLVYGGLNAGVYLCNHAGIDEIHITGSASTHDAIVFGSGAEGAERKRNNMPANTRRVTSELGNVSPTIVVPGPWAKADLRFQAEHILTQKMHNGGFNCIAAQVLVLPEKWNLTGDLLNALHDVTKRTPPRYSYYPGAANRQAATVEAHPDAEILDSSVGEGVVPRTLVRNLNYSDTGEVCFRVEAFDSVLSETRVPGDDTITYLQNAVNFCNDTLWGTLGANIIIHPATIKSLGPAFEQVIADLRYGCVAVNAWTGVGFLMAPATWGAFPGHTQNDIQSGIGVVHNTYLFDRAQKSVVRQPFYPYPRSYAHGMFTLLPKPPWFITNKTAAEVGRLLTHFEAHPSMARLPRIFTAALRG